MTLTQLFLAELEREAPRSSPGARAGASWPRRLETTSEIDAARTARRTRRGDAVLDRPDHRAGRAEPDTAAWPGPRIQQPATDALVTVHERTCRKGATRCLGRPTSS